MVAPFLAALIRKRREQILAAWLDQVLATEHNHYRQRPVDQVRSWLADGLNAIQESLERESHEPLEAHAAAIGASRQQLGFEIDEVVDALLLFKEVVMQLPPDKWTDESAERAEIGAAVDRTLRALVTCFTARFTSALRAQPADCSGSPVSRYDSASPP